MSALRNGHSHSVTDTYTACSIIEGFCDFNATSEDELNAWSYLVETGQAFQLQGFYGRGAMDLIDQGILARDGAINREAALASGLFV